MLTSIGIKLVLNALTGKGLHVDRNRPTRSLDAYTPGSSGGAHSMYPLMPPPFLELGQKVLLDEVRKKITIEKGGRVNNESSWYHTDAGLEQDSSA